MIDKIPGWLSKNEGRLLAYFASNTNGVIVEIGSFQGKSTIYMAQKTKAKIYAIDPHLGETSSTSKPGLHHHFSPTYKKFLNNLRTFQIKNVVPIRKTSLETNKNWNKKIDLLHIDGLHEYEYAKQDLELWLKYLKPGGVVICHDAFCPFPEVFKAVNEEIFDNKEFGYIGINDSQIFAIKNKKNNFQKPFIILASNIWHTENIPYPIRDFIVKRILKPFYLNRFMILSIFRQSLFFERYQL